MTQSDIRKPTPAKMLNRQASFNQTFQSSILERQQKFTFDKTLVQGIKENDSSKIIENTQESSMGQDTHIYDQQKEVHDIFVNTRKKFDQSKQTAAKLQHNVERFKKQKEMLTSEKSKIELALTSEQNDFKRIQQQLQRLNAICETADYEKAIRLQMGEVLRQDILYYKKHCFDYNTKILRSHNKLKSLNSQVQSTKKVTTNCRALVYSIEKKITDNQTKRYSKLNSFHEVINKKMENNYKKEQREKMIEESMLQALYSKMPQEQQQKKLLFSNIVLKKLLKTKMEREMEKFSQIEGSFRKIQQNTTIKRVDQFVDKFIKRQQIYGELLQSISKNQEKINLLKQEHQKLQKQRHDLAHEKQAIEEKQNQKKNQANKQMNLNIDLLRERLLKNQFQKNKTVSFVAKFLTAFDQRVFGEVKQQLNREKPNKSLKMVLEKVNSFLDKMENQEGSEQKLKEIYIESKNLTLPNAIKAKNLRIKTLASGQQNQNSAMQNYDMAYDDQSEREFLNHNRKQIKKSTYLRNRMKTRAC